jgi:hypothetical protein
MEEEPMSGPVFAWPDICSIGAVASQGRIGGAACGVRSADGHPLADDDRHLPKASSIDCAIRLSTGAAVLAVAAIAAYVSYWHAYAVVRAYGEAGITARLEPATIDGLVYASSMVVSYAARHRLAAPSLARWLPGAGIAATLTANMTQGWSHGPVGSRPGRRSVWWARMNFLVWLIRTSGAAARGPSAEQLCNGAACSASVRPFLASAVDGERPAGSERDTSDPMWRPAGQAAGHSPIPAGGQRDEEVPEASAVNAAAVAAYRLSVQAGNPLSERRLAQMFGRTAWMS